MEGKARIAVIAVGEAPIGLSQELEKRGIAVFSGDIASVEELVDQNHPHLIALVGIRGAMEVSTLLEDQDRTSSPRVAVIAARRDLSRLWGLNRDVVISLLATEMGDKVVAGRLDALARQAAKKRGEVIESPPATSLPPRSTTDAFTTVAPQAVAAIQLVKQAQSQGAGTSPPAIEINSLEPTGESVAEIDSASLESDRPPGPEAPMPSASLLMTRAGLGLRPPTAPRRDSNVSPKSPPTTDPTSPDGDLTGIEAEATATFDSRGVVVEALTSSGSSSAEPDQASKVSPPAEDAEVSVASHSGESDLGEGSSSADTRDSGPVIDTDSLMESLRLESHEQGAVSTLAAEQEAPQKQASEEPDGDLEPDSGELTRPGKTVLGLGFRKPEGEGKGPNPDATATSPGLTGVEAKFFENEDTPPSGTAFDRPEPRASAESVRPLGAPSSVSSRPRPSLTPQHRPGKALPATLLALLAAAAGAGFYINSQAPRSETSAEAAAKVPNPPPSEAQSLSGSGGTLAAEPPPVKASESPSAEAPAPAPAETAPSEQTQAEQAKAAPAQKDADTSGSLAKGSAPEPGAPEGSAAEAPTQSPAPEPKTAQATFAPANGPLTDELLRSYLIESEVPAKTCEALVPNPKQGVRDPAAEGSVPWQAARKAIVRGDIAAAQTSMCEAAFINPQSPALESLALLYINQISPTEALKWLDKADAVRPGVRDTLDLRATALTQLGRIDEARSVWLKALNIADSDSSRRKGAADEDVAVARQHLKQGDLERAERRLRRAVVLDHGNSSALATLADVLLRKGRLAPAQALAEHAVQAEPLFPDAYVVLAEISRQANDVAGARKHLSRALEIRPDFWPAKKALKALNKANP